MKQVNCNPKTRGWGGAANVLLKRILDYRYDIILLSSFALSQRCKKNKKNVDDDARIQLKFWTCNRIVFYSALFSFN